MISDEDIEKALDYLRDSSDVAAQATALRVYLSEYRKTKKAELMNLCNEKTDGSKERFAYSHSEYKEFLVGLREAVFQDAKHRFLREAAQAKVSAWQTMNANQRALGEFR